MKRFDFPLERVRRWRSEQASVEELKLQQIRAEKNGMTAARAQIERECAQAGQSMLAQKFLDPVQLQCLDLYRQHGRVRIQELKQRELECDARILVQRQRVIEARQRYELLDKIREKALREWTQAVDKEQEALAGELFLAKSIRARRRGVPAP